jgi:hypothetical protein
MKKFKTNLLMFIVLATYLAITFFIFFKTFPSSKVALVIGIILSFVYSMISFFNKKVRSKMTVWWGFLSLLSCAWWVFLMIE